MSGFQPPPPPGGDPSSAQFVSPYGNASRPVRPSPAGPSSAPLQGASPGGPSHSSGAAGAGVLARPADDDRSRQINNVAFPGPYASPSAPGPQKRDGHLAAAEQSAVAYRADGRLASLGQPSTINAPYSEPAWAADKERESQEKKDKDVRAEREKVKRTQIEVLNRPPPFVPGQQQQQQQQQQLGGHQPPVDVKMEPQSQATRSLPHPPAPTSSMRGGPSALNSRKNKALDSTVPYFSPYDTAYGPSHAQRREKALELQALASPPNPPVRTPFLPSTLGRQAPLLGRFVYGGPQWMFPSDISRKGTELAATPGPGLQNGPGGKIEIIIPAGYLGSGWTLRTTSQGPDTTPSAGWKRLLAGINLERRVWGTEVYTDDSDLVGVLVHGGWLVPASPSAAEGAGADGHGKRKRPNQLTEAGLRVEVRVVGRLLRFIGTDRHGIKSRGWGNGHDGASIIVENVSRIENARPPTLSRRTKRPRIAQILQMRNELVDEVSQETLSVNVFGGAGYKYSPAALMEAMELSEIEPPEDDVVAETADGGDAVEPKYTKLRPDLQDSDLVLENTEERYRIRLDSPTTSLLSIRIFPKSDPPTVLQPASPSALDHDEGEPLGGGLVRQRDLEWVEGGLIVRESAAEGGGTGQGQLLSEQTGWYCAVSRWWWEMRPASGTPGASAKGGASTIPDWVGQAIAASAEKVDEAQEGEQREKAAPAKEAEQAESITADVSMEG